MNEFNDGKLYRSPDQTFGLSTTIDVPLTFLNAARNFTVPEVAALVVEFTGSVDAATGVAATGYDFAKLIDKCQFIDGGGAVVDASGQALRLNEMMELGDGQVDPADVALNTVATRTWRVVIPFELPKARRPRDTMIPLYHFLEGGQFTISTPAALPSNWDDFTSGKVRLLVLVKDGRRTETKSRLTLNEYGVTKQEDEYNINGSLRSAVFTTKLTTTSASSWAAYTSINSRTLGFPPNLNPDEIRWRYRYASDRINANDPILAATPLALPIITPDRFQKIPNMPDLRTLHVDLGAAPPSNARLFTSVVKNRNPDLAAFVSGYANVGDYQAALEQNGEVVSAKGKNVSVKEYDPVLVRRLPTRIASLIP